MRYIIFLLILGILTGTAAAQDGSSNISEDIFILSCSTGETIIGGIKFTFVNVNPGFQYRVSAIGINGFDPVIAVSTSPGYGNCNDDTGFIEGSQVAVPDIGLISATRTAAQVEINTGRGGNIDVLVGGYEGATGQFTMIVEGLSINPASDADGFLVSVPSVVQELPMGVYMVAQEGSGINPYLEAYYGTGLQGYSLDFNAAEVFAWCDDAGSGECSASDFTGGGMFIMNGYSYYADYYSAGLVVTPQTTDRLLYVFVSSGSASQGYYGLVITGNAPGYLSDDSAGDVVAPADIDIGDCIPVPAVVSYVSSEYDSRYPANALLDSNAATGWSSTQEDTAPILILELGSPVQISSILFNNYPASGASYANDAVKDFYVSIPTADGGGEVVIVNSTASQDTDYKLFTFDPVTTETLFFAFTSNYGGDYFEASDIVVCQ